MIRAVDEWCGDNMLRPFIILTCQRIEWTQHKFGNLMRLGFFSWLLANNILGLIKNPWFWPTWVILILLLWFGGPYLWLWYYDPDFPREPDPRWVRFSTLVLISFFGILAAIANSWSGLVLTLSFVVMSLEEYSRTIPEIPPREKRQALKEARA